MPARLSYRFEPLTDLYLLLTDPRSIPADGWSAAWDAIRPILESVADAGFMAQIIFHGTIAEATSIEELEAFREQLTGDDREFGLPWRDLIGQAIDALRVASPLYDRDVSTARRELVDEARASVVDTLLAEHADECFGFIESALELPANGITVPVRLVASSFWPGAFTSRSMESGAICFVGVGGLDPSTLIEMILHEAIHALEELSPAAQTSVLHRFEEQLVARGIADDPAFSQVTHSLFFVQAAETVRRIVDQRHIHYGVTHAYYDRVPTSKPVLEHWVAHLDGVFDADATIDAIVSDLINGA